MKKMLISCLIADCISFSEKMIRRKNDFGFVFLLFCKKECTDFLKNQELELTIRALY